MVDPAVVLKSVLDIVNSVVYEDEVVEDDVVSVDVILPVLDSNEISLLIARVEEFTLLERVDTE